MRYLTFKTYRTEKAFDDVDPRLRGAVRSLAQDFAKQWHKPLVVTCTQRTEKENEIVGGHPQSGHKDDPVRAVDIRTDPTSEHYNGWSEPDYPGLTVEEVHWIRDYWKRWFAPLGVMWNCVIEDNHIHLQCPKGA